MKKYLNLLNLVCIKGQFKKDRTGVGTLSIFGEQLKFDLLKGFPLITTKKCHFKSIIYELLWFLKGDTNIKYLNKNKITIWNSWANKKGDLGPIYGKQWRSWKGYNGEYIDQLKILIKQLKFNSTSRRMIVSAWNVAELNKMSLVPCHVMFQFYVINKIISCQVYQRSCDIFIGLPFNIASYALLTNIIAHQCNLKLGNLIWVGGDIHLYLNHLKQAKIQLNRIPKKLPKLLIKRLSKSIFNYKYNDFNLLNYIYHPAIKASVAI